ncbi:MAG: hydroxymethylglutaryl-CoA reductase, degradative [Bacteroidota bacterium]
MKWIVENFFKDPDIVMRELKSYWLKNEAQQKIIDGFSENTISNFHLPFGVAPNFVINGKAYCIPMVIEESSVVAAASSAAKFWMNKGGFSASVIETEKIGQVHFLCKSDKAKLFETFNHFKNILINEAKSITCNMEKRGGGIKSVKLLDLSSEVDSLFQLKVSFDTCDSMGANFINSVLENFAQTLQNHFDVEIVMSILSNYTPNCLVKASVECPIEQLADAHPEMDGKSFAEKFELAIKIAHLDIHRATTHNKGIFNGIDALVLATGNDFRAIEACGHTYAARDGQYRSLSHCSIENGIFKFWLEIPLAIGTVGGLTSLHPIAKRSLELLGNPDAEELMKIMATLGLAQNFAAVKSLITTGIQKGHMKMHLSNILIQLEASDEEEIMVKDYFENRVISFNDVRSYLENQRAQKIQNLSSQ